MSSLLTVFCDASVSIIIVSSSGILHEYISPSIKTKHFFDEYQRRLGIDLWSSHYERMQEQLKKLKEVNWNLRTQTRQKMGECLNDLSFQKLRGLELDIDDTLKVIRERKMVAIKNQMEIYKKKIRNEQTVHVDFQHDLESLKSKKMNLSSIRVKQ